MSSYIFKDLFKREIDPNPKATIVFASKWWCIFYILEGPSPSFTSCDVPIQIYLSDAQDVDAKFGSQDNDDNTPCRHSHATFATSKPV